MHDPAFQHVIGRESRLCGTAAQIGFLEIEKKAFVKQTDPVQHRLAHHQTGPRQPIHTARPPRPPLRPPPPPPKAAYNGRPRPTPSPPPASQPTRHVACGIGCATIQRRKRRLTGPNRTCPSNSEATDAAG